MLASIDAAAGWFSTFLPRSSRPVGTNTSFSRGNRSGQVISTRSCRKEGETSVEKLKATVVGLFELETWRRFVERNFKTFPRYARDQCLEAKEFFAEKEVDPGILERALAYCLENDTPSFTNLRDTYVHFERESRQAALNVW